MASDVARHLCATKMQPKTLERYEQLAGYILNTGASCARAHRLTIGTIPRLTWPTLA